MNDYYKLKKKTGLNIRAGRKNLKLTALDFAGKAQISETTLLGIETGKRAPSLSTIVAIASVLDTTIDFLVYGDDNV